MGLGSPVLQSGREKEQWRVWPPLQLRPTCESPGTLADWTWSLPGSVEDPGHSALSSFSGTPGLEGEKSSSVSGELSAES